MSSSTMAPSPSNILTDFIVDNHLTNEDRGDYSLLPPLPNHEQEEHLSHFQQLHQLQQYTQQIQQSQFQQNQRDQQQNLLQIPELQHQLESQLSHQQQQQHFPQQQQQQSSSINKKRSADDDSGDEESEDGEPNQALNDQPTASDFDYRKLAAESQDSMEQLLVKAGGIGSGADKAKSILVTQW